MNKEELKTNVIQEDSLRNTKIYLSNEDDRIKFQEMVFKLGVSWRDGLKNVECGVKYPFYYIDNNLRMTKDSICQKDFFKECENKQIFLDDVLSISSIKKIMNKENLKKELIEKIIQQIVDDVENDDVEPIEEMISLIMSKSNMKYLIGYLSDVDSPVKYEDLLS